jgi:acyl-CoA synthetase (AMP-forming)/AMP-acid ligase II
MPITGLALERPINLSQLLETSLGTKPHEPALWFSVESQWTWHELDQASQRLAANYLELGPKPGDRVASLVPNRGALIVHFHAKLHRQTERCDAHSRIVRLDGRKRGSWTGTDPVYPIEVIVQIARVWQES